jgi:hypothetical protein
MLVRSADQGARVADTAEPREMCLVLATGAIRRATLFIVAVAIFAILPVLGYLASRSVARREDATDVPLAGPAARS